MLGVSLFQHPFFYKPQSPGLYLQCWDKSPWSGRLNRPDVPMEGVEARLPKGDNRLVISTDCFSTSFILLAFRDKKWIHRSLTSHPFGSKHIILVRSAADSRRTAESGDGSDCKRNIVTTVQHVTKCWTIVCWTTFNTFYTSMSKLANTKLAIHLQNEPMKFWRWVFRRFGPMKTARRRAYDSVLPEHVSSCPGGGNGNADAPQLDGISTYDTSIIIYI